MLGDGGFNITHVNLYFLGVRFGSRGGLSASVSSPVEFELLARIWDHPIVIVLVETAGVVVTVELQESIFKGKACHFVLY